MQAKRNWTPEEKMQIVHEGLRGDATVAEVCRRHGISATLYYEWKDKLMNGAGEIFKHGNGKPDHEADCFSRRVDVLLASLEVATEGDARLASVPLDPSDDCPDCDGSCWIWSPTHLERWKCVKCNGTGKLVKKDGS